jgi:hypothetical protein
LGVDLIERAVDRVTQFVWQAPRRVEESVARTDQGIL